MSDTTVSLKGENKQLKATLDDSERSVVEFKDSFLAAMSATAAGVAVATGGLNLLMGGFSKLLNVGPDLVSSFLVQEKAEKAVESQLKRTGDTVGYTADQLKLMASRLQVLTGAGDESILMAQSLIGRFSNIRGENFEEVTRLSIDMSKALGIQLNGAADKLGKALQSPIQGMAMLKESGVFFTKAQGEVVKSMMETGDVLGAQRILLDEIAKVYGGTAADSLKTFGGAVEALWGRIGDLKEVGGKIIVEFLKPFIPLLGEGISFLENISGAVTEFATSIAEGFGNKIEGVREFFKGMLQAGVTAFSALQTGWANSQDLLGAGWEMLREGLVGAMVAIKDILKDLFTNTIPNLLLGLLKSFYAVFDDIAAYATKTLNKVLREAQGWTADIVSMANIIADVTKTGVQSVVTSAVQTGQGAADLATGRRTAEAGNLEKYIEEQKKLATEQGERQDTASNRLGDAFSENLAKNQAVMQGFLDMFNQAVPKHEGAATASDKAFELLGVELDKKEKEKKEKKEKEEKVATSSAGSFEGLEDTWKRISGAAAGGPEEKRHKEQVGKLEDIVKAIEEQESALVDLWTEQAKEGAGDIFDDGKGGKDPEAAKKEAKDREYLQFMKELLNELKSNTAVNQKVAETIGSVGTLT